MANNNPLLADYKIPPMDKIEVKDFEPAIDHVIEEARTKLTELKNNSSKPDFENTVVALDRAFTDMVRVEAILGSLMGAKMSDELVAVEESVSKKISSFKKEVFQDKGLAERFKVVAEPTSDEDKVLYKKLSRDFEVNGAFLDDAGQKRIKDIDDKMIGLCSKFMDNLNKGTKQQAVLFTDEKDIAGLPESIVGALREAAQNAGHDKGWLVVPERLLIDDLLEVAENRDFRKKIYDALASVGTQEPYNNEPVIKEIQALRHERANMLGYPNHAAYALSNTMAGKVDRAEALMDKLAEKALPKFADSVRTVQAFAQSHGGPRTIEAWDLPYWANKYKQETFQFDAAKFSEYLPLDKVTEGFFKTASRIFDVTFKENTSYPVYHPDVKTYDVVDNKTGELAGIIYADFFAREGTKQGGAWMTQLQQQLPGHPAIVTMNMNLLKGTDDKPTLLSPKQLETFFHEGGHAMHGVLGNNTRHPSLQGVTATSDYIEFFSTVMENWASKKEVLDSFAGHYKTGDKLPEELFKAMEDSKSFLAERDMLKVTQNSRRDFAFHKMDPASYTTSKDLENAADFDHPNADHIRSYPFNRWSHLYQDAHSQYAAGYYGYQWSEGLAQTGFKKFAENGLFDKDSCERLTKLYKYGSSRDMNKAYEEFLGKPLTPEIMATAMLESVGADKTGRVSQTGYGEGKRAGGGR